MKEPQLRRVDTEANTHQTLHEFAATLTTRARELDAMEREYEIVPGQAADILTQMIEGFVYAVVRTMVHHRMHEYDDLDRPKREDR